jgi:ribulose-5-phosphate 4-epimerase/fuculose-1-phosphate aldolase
MREPRAPAPEEGAILEDFCHYCRHLYERRLVTGVGGNLALRVGKTTYLSPSGYSLGNLRPEKVIRLKNGRYLPRGLKVTQDANMHLAILDARPDVQAVCHVHGASIIAASTLLTPGPDSLPALTPGFAFFAYPLTMLPFLAPGSEKLARAVCEILSVAASRAVLLKNHGLVTVGETFQEALDIAEEIDEAAKIYVLTSGKARPIPAEDIKKIG